MTTFQAEGCGIALTGDEYEVSVTDSPFCVIRYDKHSADWLAALASPYPASPDFPPKGETTHYDLCVAGAPSNHVRCASTGKCVTRFSGRLAPLRIVFPCHPCSGGRIGRSMLSCRDKAPWLSIHSAPACGGKVVAPATKGGMPEWYMKYMTLCFSPQIPCFPLRGNAT